MKVFSRSTTSADGVKMRLGHDSVPKGRFCPFEKGRVVRDSRFLDDAVLYVARNYDPIRIHIYGPAAAGFVDHYKTFDMMVIVDESLASEEDSLETEIRRRLLKDFRVDGNIVVMTDSEFRDDSRIGGSEANFALNSGYVAYEA